MLNIQETFSESDLQGEEKKEASEDGNNAVPRGLNLEEHIEFSGYAYSGGGRSVTRVELSLDAGVNWDITELIETVAPTSHGMQWCWIFWRARVPARLLLNATEVWCRAWDEANNTQPISPTWNLMGLVSHVLEKRQVWR